MRITISNVVFTSALRLKDVEYALRLVQGLQMSRRSGSWRDRGSWSCANAGGA